MKNVHGKAKRVCRVVLRVKTILVHTGLHAYMKELIEAE